MRKTKFVIFDFDGTIADTLGLGLRIYNELALEYNLVAISDDIREMLRARKLQEILKTYGISNRKFFLLSLRIKKEFARHIHETEPVNEMEAALREIKNAGYKLGILTSNSANNVSKFLDINSLSGMIGFIYSGKSIFGKDRVIRHMLTHENIPEEDVIYVGDETRDIEASKKAGIPVIAVTWGLNRREVLASLLPDNIADEPKDLLPAVQQIFNRQKTRASHKNLHHK